MIEYVCICKKKCLKCKKNSVKKIYIIINIMINILKHIGAMNV